MTATDSPTPAPSSPLPRIAAFVALIVLVAVVASALALRYGGPSGASLAAEACVDQASPASTFVVDESFSVDALADSNAEDLEGWPAVAKNVELQSDPDDSVDSFWVVGAVDDIDAVCIVDFTDGVLLTEPQFVQAEAFDQFR